jgi:heme/copper-type cytochrome/quinol oxidase subunit 2
VTLRRLSFLQWVGFLVGGPIWFAEFLAGIGSSQASCNPGSKRWHVPHDAVQIGLMTFASVAVIVAFVAAVVVFRETKNVEEQEAPPAGRIHFFAAASIAGNVIFFAIILLTGIATIVDRTCLQS